MDDDDEGLRVQVTGAWLLDRGMWMEVSGLLGINEWAINEGQLDSSEWLTLTADQARQLGILPARDI